MAALTICLRHRAVVSSTRYEGELWGGGRYLRDQPIKSQGVQPLLCVRKIAIMRFGNSFSSDRTRFGSRVRHTGYPGLRDHSKQTVPVTLSGPLVYKDLILAVMWRYQQTNNCFRTTDSTAAHAPMLVFDVRHAPR